MGADGTEPVLVDLEKEGVEGALGDVVAGCDAVVFAAGAGAGSGDARKASMDHGGAVKLVEAAEERGVRRYLMLSGMGVDDPAAVPETLRPYARADERLRRGGLDWTGRPARTAHGGRRHRQDNGGAPARALGGMERDPARGCGRRPRRRPGDGGHRRQDLRRPLGGCPYRGGATPAPGGASRRAVRR